MFPLSNSWSYTSIAGFASEKLYVVQTTPKVIQRCLLMTTDPGDLVLDPICGSGTTAYVAEQWGRRRITCDTSRVALTLAKQRLTTADRTSASVRAQCSPGPDGACSYRAQSCRVDGCAGTVRLRDRQNHAFASSRNPADRSATISSVGSIASATSRAERRGGPTSRGGPSVLPIKLSHKPPGASAAATCGTNRCLSLGSSKT